MKLILKTPVKLQLPLEWVGTKVEQDLRKELRYEDLSATHEWKRWKEIQKADDKRPGTHWFVRKEGRKVLDEKVEELNSQRIKEAVFLDKSGRLYTYSGLARSLSKKYGLPIAREYKLPEPQILGWDRPPPPLRPYQKEAVELLLAETHAGVSLATGMGKTLCIAEILRRIGTTGVVVVPTLSIATQMYADFCTWFGKGKIGRFYGGKKESSKRFVIAVSKSLTAVEPGSREESELKSKDVVCGDECHLLPAETLSKVILRLLSKAPYRFFFSGTHIRSDGLDTVLEGITGPVVMSMDVADGVRGGFLSAPRFIQYKVSSRENFYATDSIKMNRRHLHRNPVVYTHVVALVKKAIEKKKRPLILLEEISQFPYLAELSGFKLGFAHGGLDAKMKTKIPEIYWKSDPLETVKAFDAGELDILVGTQCIGTGTDIKTADFIVDLVGLASEVRIRQNVGRGTRRSPTKDSFVYIDYDIHNIKVLSRHAEKRRSIFESIGPVRVI
jgi:superfamily II DNA or RNA helicase